MFFYNGTGDPSPTRNITTEQSVVILSGAVAQSKDL